MKPVDEPLDATPPESLPSQPASDGEGGQGSAAQCSRPSERGGPSGPEPTRYGDWERKGRCIDF